MFWDGVSLNLDHFSFEQAFVGPFPNSLLQTFDQALVLLHRAGPDSDMVVLGKDPGVEVRRDVGADIHLSQIFVVGHLLCGELDSFLEGDGDVVIARIHGLGDTGVGTVGSDDQIHIESFLFPGGTTAAVIGVMQGVRPLTVHAGVDLLNKAIHKCCAEIGGPVAQKGVEHFAATHADEGVVVVAERIQTNVHLAVGGGDHLHVADLAVDDLVRQVEFFDHAERNRSSTWLGVIQLAFKQPGLNSSFGEHLGCTGSTRTTADHCNTQHLSHLRWTVF